MTEYTLVAATLGVSMIAGVAALQSASGSELSATASGWQTMASSLP